MSQVLGGGGGGGSAAPAAPAQTVQKPVAPNTNFLSGQGSPATQTTKVAQPIDFLRQAIAQAPMSQATQGGQSYLYDANYKPKDEKRSTEFMGGGRQQASMSAPGMVVDRRADVRSMASSDPGTAVPSVEGMPPATYAVAQQSFAGAPPGGDGFGRRALIGSEGDVVTQALPSDTVQQTDTPTATVAGDVIPVGDPLTPGAAIAPDVNYVLMTQQGIQGNGFTPGSQLAQQVATGPFSRYLQSGRQVRGFGSRLMNI